MYIVLGIIIIAYGVVSVAFPEVMFEIGEILKYRDIPEPSDFYLKLIRVSGVMLVIVGVVIVVLRVMDILSKF